MLVDFVCLASSTKFGGRCVAGIRADGGGWVRPVSRDTDHGQLQLRHMKLNDGSEPRVLDLIRVDLACARPGPGHPENWEIGKRPWELISRPAEAEVVSMLNAAVTLGPLLLESPGGQIVEHAASALSASLALVLPSRLRWKLRKGDFDVFPQPRVLFDLEDRSYDLPVTDPLWTTRIRRALAEREPGEHAQEAIGVAAESKFLITVSLSEPFHGVCYKLAASMIVVPDSGVPRKAAGTASKGSAGFSAAVGS